MGLVWGPLSHLSLKLRVPWCKRHNTGPTSLANEVVPGVLGQNTQEERGEVMRGGGGGEVKNICIGYYR